MKYAHVTDKELEESIQSRLAIFKMLHQPSYERVVDIIESLRDSRDDLIEFLIAPVPIYPKHLEEPKGVEMNKISDKERLIISEEVLMPHVGKVEIDGVIYPVKTAKRLTIYPTYIRKNQQISNKEAKSAESDNSSDVLGQAAGASKVGTFSDAEVTVCLQHNLYNIVKELSGPASHDVEQKKVYRNNMMSEGEVSMKDLPEAVENKRSILYLDQMLKTMGIDTDLIQYPE